MITSIVLTGTHKIGIDSYGKFMVGDVKVSTKEVPFVRYRFDNFADKELDYIKEMKKTFNFSAHMAEVTIGEDTVETLNKIGNIGNIVRFVYIPVDDTDVLDGFSEEKMELFKSILGINIDRLMLKDKSTNLDTVASLRLKKQLNTLLNIPVGEIGVCSSPLSFDGKNACLTAVKARELSAEYAESDEVALPSSNHECMNCCGCIRYHLFNCDVEAPIAKKGTGGTKTSTKEKKESTGEKSKATKKPAAKGIMKWK